MFELPSTPPPARQKLRVSLQVAIVCLFLLVIGCLSGLIIGFNYWLNRDAAVNTAGVLLEEVDRAVASEVLRLFDPAISTADLAPLVPGIDQLPDTAAHPALPFLFGAVNQHAQIASAYIGFANGDFLRVVNLGEGYGPSRVALGAPDTSRSAVQRITRRADGQRVEFWTFLDAAGLPVGTKENVAPAYDPRQRGWYQLAEKSAGAVITDPYLFASVREVGRTAARRVGSPVRAVFGIDLTQASMSRYVRDVAARAGHSLSVFLFDAQGRITAHADFATAMPAPADDPNAGQIPTLAAATDPVLHAVQLELARTGGAFDQSMLQTPKVTYVTRIHPLPAAVAGVVPVTTEYVAVLAPLDDFVVPIFEAGAVAFAVSLAVVLLSLPLVVVIARRIAQPLRYLAEEADRIRDFDISVPLTLDSRIREVSDLVQATQLMKNTLTAFGKYVPRDLVRSMLRSNLEARPGGERRQVTLLFTDIEDFTTISEQMEPEALMRKMSRYFDGMVTTIHDASGTVDKFVGDAVMAYWNAPMLVNDHAAVGVAATLRCAKLSNAMNAEWRRNGEQPLHTRFGLHLGECIVGNVGSKDRLDFTVIGASVNLASRLEGLNKHYGTQILTSEATRDACADRFLFRTVDMALPKGAVRPTRIYELIGAMPGVDPALADIEASPEDVKLCAAWEATYAHYMARHWQNVMTAIGTFNANFPGDRLAQVYMKRTWLYLQDPPGPDWDGVEQHLSK